MVIVEVEPVLRCPLGNIEAHALEVLKKRVDDGGMFVVDQDIYLRTPIGSEGSITVGHLQDVRVKRAQTQSAIDMGRFDYRYEVTLTIENFTDTTVHMDVVDYLAANAEQLAALGLDPGMRAETLSPQRLAQLADACN